MLKKDHSNNIHVIFLFLLGCRLVFIFSNAAKSPSLQETDDLPATIQTTTQIEQSNQTENFTTQQANNQEPSQQVL